MFFLYNYATAKLELCIALSPVLSFHRDMVGEDVTSVQTAVHRPGPGQHCSQVSACRLGPQQSTARRHGHAWLLQAQPTTGSDPIRGEDLPVSLQWREEGTVLRVAQTGHQEEQDGGE